MPYKVLQDGDKWAVHKVDAEGHPMGAAMGEHDSEEEAIAQMRALYANEKKSWAIKFASEDETWIEGLGMPFGGPFNGRDLDGEFFSQKTDFAFDWFTERPLLYHHGLDKDTGIAVIGKVKSYEVKADLGVWTKAQLDASSEYFEAIKELVKQGKLFFSSGAMRHLVKVNKKSGEITRWPWVEMSTTPTPSNLYAEASMAAKHFDIAGLKAVWGQGAKAINEDLFWGHVQKQEGNGHWLWTGARNTKGYGILEVDGATVRAHRVAYELAHGPIPDGKDVGHKTECATTSCVRASHLELITNDQNAAERATRKAVWSAAEVNDLPDSAFAYIEPEGEKDDEGKTKPRALRHFPYRNADGDLDEAHVRNALARIPQSNLPQEAKDKALGVIHGAAKELGIEISEAKADIDDFVASLWSMPLTAHAELVDDMAASLLERTKGLQERRIKEGRMISDANRKRLMGCMESMRGAMDEMEGLLSASEPKAKADEAKSRAMLTMVAHQLETLQTYADTLAIRRP